MSPEAQKQLHQRMEEWVRLTPDQRKVARENYQVSKSVPPDKREKAWDAYQKLSEEQKKKLAASEHMRRPTVVSAPPTGKTEVKDINRLVTAREQGHVPGHAEGGSGAAAAPAAPVSGTPIATGHSERREHRPGHADSGLAAAGAFDVQRLVSAAARGHRDRRADARAQRCAAASRRCSTKA